MLTKVDVFLRLNDVGLQLPMEAVKTELSKIDQQTFFAEERKRYTIKIWDKNSEINHILPEQIKTQTGYFEEGEVYIIYLDNNLLTIQVHDPSQGGFASMAKEDALKIANQQADQLAWAAAHERIFHLLLEQLL